MIEQTRAPSIDEIIAQAHRDRAAFFAQSMKALVRFVLRRRIVATA